jgi:hypothetical protein
MHQPGERGSILLLGFIVSLLLLLTTIGAVNTALTTGKEAQYELDQTRALAVAEGTTEKAQRQMLEAVSNFMTFPPSGTVKVAGIDYPYNVTPIGTSLTLTDPDGVNLSVQHYQISSSVNTGDGYATVDRIVDLTMTPLFQYMIFYQDDLEILPGPNMTLGGRVHTNGSVYVGSGNTLTVDTEYFRAVESIYRKRKNDGSESGGTVDIKVTGESTYVEMDNLHDSEFSDWTTYALDTWKETVQDGAHGVKEIAAPDIQNIKAFNGDGTKAFYHSKADLVVVDGNAFDKDGNVLVLPPNTITQTTMYDGREGKVITVSEVDMGLLNSSGHFPANGLLYAYRTDATASQPNGIRLTNGAELEAPLTVVSETSVYVHGDYNTVEKKGAAVMADAVNLLSNAWNDTKTAGSLPRAANTTYNLAFVTGNVQTPDGGGPYSGGFENLPRFHEKWSGRTATIRGSFINIYESEIAKAPWHYGGDVYTAPVRDWQYDTDLSNMENLPPFTPSAVYFQRVLWDDRLPAPF